MPRRKTNDEFKQEVYELVGNEYIFIDNYQGAKIKVRVKHNKCKHIYSVAPSNFLDGQRCPYCAKLSRRCKLAKTLAKTDEQFKKEVYELVGNEYTFLDAYVNNKTKLKVKHNKCGRIYKVAPHDFFKGGRCHTCSSKAQRKANTQFKQEVYDLVGNEYEFLDTYVNARTKLRVKHIECNNTYKVKPDSFLHGSRCPYCSSPKGELIISKILNKLSIPYEPQKTFDDLKDKDCLSYDFFIPSQNILIEYQGLQHYKPIDYFGGYATFKKQRRHDKLKAEYAKLHNYSLISIPYTEDTSFKIKKYLIKHGLKKF